MGNYIGLAFAKTVNDLNDSLPKSRGDCFDYGSSFGCSIHCPVFERGDCETVKEDPKDFVRMIEEDDPEEADYAEIKAMYPELGKLVDTKDKNRREAL